jgi:DNA repair exonuclease SbcCD ATPase subunit
MDLKSHSALRDPTVHELHNGPGKEKLPEAVKKMKKAETVCGFCGVSYLVFSEVKELEKRLKETEEKLKLVNQKAAQHDELKSKVNKMCAAAEKTQTGMKEKQDAWEKERSVAKEEADKLKIRIGALEAKKRRQEAVLERYKRKLPVVHQFLQLERDTLRETRSEVDDAQRDIADMADQILERVRAEAAASQASTDKLLELQSSLHAQAKILSAAEQALQAQKDECAELKADLEAARAGAGEEVERAKVSSIITLT